MKQSAMKLAFGAGIIVLCLSLSPRASSQDTNSTLSGKITDSTGAVVPDAKISVKNVATGQSTEIQGSLAGLYSVPNLAPGDYQVSVSAEGFATKVTKVTLSTGASQTMNLSLQGVLSLGDLGFPIAQTQGSAADQARLDKRSHMLKIHQKLGLIDTFPLVATVIAGAGAGGKSTSTSDRYLHAALGSATATLYFTSAYYAIRAPKIPGTQTRGPIRAHKILAWIHGPGMILTPILGAMAFDQKSKGEKVHGIARAHGPVAIVTASAYGAAILAVTFKW
ncbi:MAG: carboxypeptidase-like regulatory domain-containing protein [Candidatus Acidiferrum sp.]